MTLPINLNLKQRNQKSLTHNMVWSIQH